MARISVQLETREEYRKLRILAKKFDPNFYVIDGSELDLKDYRGCKWQYEEDVEVEFNNPNFRLNIEDPSKIKEFYDKTEDFKTIIEVYDIDSGDKEGYTRICGELGNFDRLKVREDVYRIEDTIILPYKIIGSFYCGKEVEDYGNQVIWELEYEEFYDKYNEKVLLEVIENYMKSLPDKDTTTYSIVVAVDYDGKYYCFDIENKGEYIYTK